MPTGASSGNSSKPSDLSDIPSSVEEHNIPNDSTPRSLPFLIFRSLPSGNGSTAPTNANGTFKPARTLLAPHTICSTSPCPLSTLQTLNLSASGCFSRSITCPTTMPLKAVATGSRASTSQPDIVSLSAITSNVSGVSIHSRSHFSLTFIRLLRLTKLL